MVCTRILKRIVERVHARNVGRQNLGRRANSGPRRFPGNRWPLVVMLRSLHATGGAGGGGRLVPRRGFLKDGAGSSEHQASALLMRCIDREL